MSHETILGHIVSRRLSRHYEDTATEALAYLLRASADARAAVVDLLRATCPELSLEADLRFETQRREEQSRIDLAGVGDGERLAVFFENKFWAGLTSGQPVRYLEILAQGRAPTILLVVTPQLRVDTLWSELERRLRAAGEPLQVISRRPPRLVHLASVGEGRRIALTSWSLLLQAIAERVADKPRVLADLEQLRGLCQAADSQAFVPLDREDLTDQRVPARLINYVELVRAIVHRARAKQLINRKSLRTSHAWWWIGRYFRFGRGKGVGAWIGVDLRRWKRHGRTPIWIEWTPGAFGQAALVRSRLTKWASERGFLLDDDGKSLALALDLRTACERDEVIDGGVSIISQVGEQLRDLVGADPPPPDEDET